MAYFPMYVEIKDNDCLIVGGGRVALRKVEVLLDFQAKVHVIAEEMCDEINELFEKNRIVVTKKKFEPEDIDKCILVVAATDNHQLNHKISEIAKRKGIPVNAVDQKEDCTFIFPSYVKEQNLVAAFSSSGKSPVITQYLKEREKEILTSFLGEVNEYLGSIRQEVIDRYQTEEERKLAFKQILEYAIENKVIPEGGKI